ncbi:cytochrome-c peroxidase [Flavobacterium sp. H122]|uniref:cytochrome-c peroxidase n=1 Tax=Flavobacterium sp. H122 TaxID=2529860 RepID=UPI0010A9B5EF|nr:cytochrome c peroxidase [Flavobacterium sp. H122]
MKNVLSLVKKAIVLNSLLLLTLGCKNEKAYESRETFMQLEKEYKKYLENSALALDKINAGTSIKEMKSLYKEAKKQFKLAEPILAFIDDSNYKAINQPNIIKVNEEDATNIRISNPFGFQVLEEIIHSSKPDYEQIQKEAKLTSGRLKLLKNNGSLSQLGNHHILWIIRDAINRVALKGITGFDSTVALTSLEDSKNVYESIKKILTIFEASFTDKQLYKDWITEIETSQKLLQTDFNKFDRYNFIKNHTHKSLGIWNKTVKDWKIKFEIKQALNYNIISLFDKNTFNTGHFTDQDEPDNSDKISLGKQLFNDEKLSDSKTMSCATCHKPELAFTDGKKKSTETGRNSPTLLYAGLQKGFFYDNRTGGLEGQIVDVINNPKEFHSSLDKIADYVKKSDIYPALFQKVFKQSPADYSIRSAIAAYILSLNPFNSKFDRNISNKENTLTQSEINGFSLFMGKAKCATCHFAPLFNGTVPGSYRESEMELIGVPESKSKTNPKIDSDLGRFEVFKTENRKYFFKTPTLRNIAKTAPYMHNGVYTTLEEVIDFYNSGGGNGLGLQLEFQTLPFNNLSLTDKEKSDLVAFMKTLSD